MTELADATHVRRLRARPFDAAEDGVPGFDDLVPDLSAAGEEQFCKDLHAMADVAAALRTRDNLSAPDVVTLGVIDHVLSRELDVIEAGTVEFTVAPVLAEGPSAILSVSARACPATTAEAADLLTRSAGFASYLDAHADRLRAGAARGRTPVASLVAAAVDQVDGVLADASGGVLAAIPAAVRPDVISALVRWRQTATSLPARADEACGLAHLPDGDVAYARLVHAHTTLDLAVDDIHQIGLDEVAATSAELVRCGRDLGLSDLPAVLAAIAGSAAGASAASVEGAARVALQRAEAIVAETFAGPTLPPCDVRPMPPHLGALGHAPHYTPPRQEETSYGVFWYNAQHPEVGAGWTLEALTFHEAVPGHHLQLAWAQLQTDLPELQRHGFVTAYGEGWALYAEALAIELDLYSCPESRLGALALRLFRAARLVVDTGIHAYGWSRGRATRWLLDTVPLPPAFAAAEVARYIAAPGQALGYLLGQREITRLREDAEARQRAGFSLREFHRAVLDNGSLPLPILAEVVGQSGTGRSL